MLGFRGLEWHGRCRRALNLQFDKDFSSTTAQTPSPKKRMDEDDVRVTLNVVKRKIN